jgi:hypothetical protein
VEKLKEIWVATKAILIALVILLFVVGNIYGCLSGRGGYGRMDAYEYN